MNCATKWSLGIAAIACVCWRFPLFHLVPLKTATAEKAAAAFDAAKAVETYWTNQLPAAIGQAVNADQLLTAIKADPTSAKKKFSRSLGMGESYLYFVAGSGRVVAVLDDEVSLAVTDGGTNPEISLQTGLIFGNALRDGLGGFNASDYPNSQDFNDLAAALNHLVETRVLPKLRGQAKVGANISFAGCAEVDDESTDLKPLKVIPLQTGAQ